MTALQELIDRLEGDVRKSWVDYYLELERKQIQEAFEMGQYNAIQEDGDPLVSGEWYYHLMYGIDGRKISFLPQE